MNTHESRIEVVEHLDELRGLRDDRLEGVCASHRQEHGRVEKGGPDRGVQLVLWCVGRVTVGQRIRIEQVANWGQRVGSLKLFTATSLEVKSVALHGGRPAAPCRPRKNQANDPRAGD